MSELSISEQLRELSKNYYQNHIRFDEYRVQRRALLSRIDAEFNGVYEQEDNTVRQEVNAVRQEDNTVRKVQPSIIDKAFGIFKDTD